MKKKACYLLTVLCISFILIGCSSSILEQTPQALPSATLIYMVADNNLDFYSMLNIRQLERGLPDNAEGPIFVFLTRRRAANPSHPVLKKIVQNHDEEDAVVRSPIIQTYRQQNTVNPDFMRRVIADVQGHAQRHNSELRRLILWSHGTGWLPEGAPFNDIDDDDWIGSIDTTDSRRGSSGFTSFAFGPDETGYGDGTEHPRKMTVKEIARALQGERFEVIMMDACFMSTVEVAYELRNVTRYFIMSPTEIVVNGFPYEDIAGLLAAEVLEPFAIAQAFFDLYDGLTGALRTGAISVINTRYLEELANAMRGFFGDFAAVRDEIPMGDFLQYDRTGSYYFFGFKDFIGRVAEQTGSDYSYILEIFGRVVPFYLHTPQVFNLIDLEGTSGLSIYIPNAHAARGSLHEFYRGLSWARDSNAAILFD